MVPSRRLTRGPGRFARASLGGARRSHAETRGRLYPNGSGRAGAQIGRSSGGKAPHPCFCSATEFTVHRGLEGQHGVAKGATQHRFRLAYLPVGHFEQATDNRRGLRPYAPCISRLDSTRSISGRMPSSDDMASDSSSSLAACSWSPGPSRSLSMSA